jgi:hypothetical protein
VEAASATAVEAASAATACAAAAACAAAISMRYATSGITTRATGIATCAASIAMSPVAVSTAAPATAAPATTAPATTAPAISAAPAVPRADADKDAAVKPVGTVIAVRGAGIRVIRVVAPLAIRWAVIAVISGIHNRGADAYSNCDLGIRHDGERQNCKHCQ